MSGYRSRPRTATYRPIGATGYAALVVVLVAGVALVATGTLTLLYNAVSVMGLALVAHCMLRPTRYPIMRWVAISVVLTFVVITIQTVLP